MAKANASSKSDAPRRLPRGRHALAPDDVLRDQRERLLAAVPAVAAERGYEAMSVADIVKAAAVSRNAFYKNFRDKQDCVATAHELGHERLFEVLSVNCYEGATTRGEGRRRSLEAALDILAGEPDAGALPLRRGALGRRRDRPPLSRVAAALRHPAALGRSRPAARVCTCT